MTRASLSWKGKGIIHPHPDPLHKWKGLIPLTLALSLVGEREDQGIGFS